MLTNNFGEIIRNNNQGSNMETPILGILSIVLGGMSLLPFCGEFALIGLILGVTGIVKKQYSTAID